MLERKNIAVVSAQGIGDGLIMHVISHHLMKRGHTVTTFNDHLLGFGAWLPGSHLKKQPLSTEELLSFDIVLLQHDNTPKANAISKLPSAHIFYGSHVPQKHGPLSPRDFVCNPNQTMVANAMQWISSPSKDTGLTPPPHLVHRKYPRRIAIHPFSTSPAKNWPPEKFTEVSQHLKTQGFDPVFLMNNTTPLCPTLESLASFLYESGAFLGNDSGPGHIASALNIPSTIIGPSEKHMRLWAPGWRPARVITPPRWSSYWKWTKNNWKHFISIKRVIKSTTYAIN